MNNFLIKYKWELLCLLLAFGWFFDRLSVINNDKSKSAKNIILENNYDNNFTEGKNNNLSNIANINSGKYTCDCNKTCKEIIICEEAFFQLEQCGCEKRDGDNDGVPCEQELCN